MSVYGVKLRRSDALRLPAHPEACTEDTFVEWCAKRSASGERLAVDLFSGAGGLSLGLEQAGWTVALGVDFDQRSLDTHRANFPGLALKLDLGNKEQRERLISLLSQVEIDLIAGGPPCQPFSRAGRSKIRSLVEAGVRDKNDLRKELWKAYLEIVLAIRPRAVLMENVPDMALGDDFSVVRTIVENLETAKPEGYHTQINLADAYKYGVPQLRKRLIVLARRDGNEFTWHSESPVLLKDAIKDLPYLKSFQEEVVGARKMPYQPEGEPNPFVALMRADVPEPNIVYDHMTRAVRDDDYEAFEYMDHNTLYFEIPERLRRYKANTFDDKYKRLDWEDYSRSITAHIAKDGYWYIHPEQHRTLTVREAARIQTFPDRFRFCGTRSDAFKQIGNAVPPRLGQAAATALRPNPNAGHAENIWLSLHQSLTEWGQRSSRGRSWFAYPGVSRPVALVVSLIGPARLEARGSGRALSPLADLHKVGESELKKLCADLGNAKMAVRLASLAEHVTTSPDIWDEPEKLISVLRMKPAEKSMFRLLTGEDVMLMAQGPLRVAARVAGSMSDTKNRLTDGRIDLARLIGGGRNAPLRMAAIRQLSTSHCLPGEPNCTGCPLRDWCRTSLKQPVSGTLY